MNLRSVSTVALLAALVAPAFAQSASSDDEASLSLTLPTDEWYVPKSKVSFGFRVLGSGINVKFGNIGAVASIRTITDASKGAATRAYDNGAVVLDTYRADEYDSNGNVKTTPGTRYQFSRTNADGSQTVVGDYLAYTPGRSRDWGYATADQVTPGVLALSNFSARSEGATAQKKEGVNGGLELSMDRDMGKLGRRFQWSLTAGFVLNGMNAKTAGTNTATLVRYTDYYTIIDPSYVGIAGGSSRANYADLLDADGNVITANGRETTAVSDTPFKSATGETVGGATVKGNWKIKGAYFLMRLGPTIRTQFTERFGLSASAGLAGAYAGSHYSATESLEIENVGSPIVETVESTTTKFIGGFYADMTLDFVATERTGLFAGVNVQNLNSYDQTVAGRTAKIDFGTAMGVRGGMSFKF